MREVNRSVSLDDALELIEREDSQADDFAFWTSRTSHGSDTHYVVTIDGHYWAFWLRKHCVGGSHEDCNPDAITMTLVRPVEVKTTQWATVSDEEFTEAELVKLEGETGDAASG